MDDISSLINTEKEKPKINFSFKRIYYFIVVLFVFIFWVYFFVFVPPSDFRSGEIFTIEDGASLRSISKNLEDLNLIKSRPIFEAFVIMYGGEKHLLPGDYLFEKKLPIFEVARRISKGDRNIEPLKVTIPEGFSVRDISEVVNLKLSKFNQDKFLKLALPDEGYLFPDTYFFFYNDTEEDVLRVMKENFEKKISKIRPDIVKLGKNENEIIVMASIIEREAKGDSDRELISGILWARISRGMALQVDAAPITYKEKGLPEKPIANPGIESIKAAIYPKNSPYLFYLHGKDGEVHYAKDFDEHRQNKLKYLR